MRTLFVLLMAMLITALGGALIAQTQPADTVTVPITGTGKDASGRAYTFSGNVSVAVTGQDTGLAPIQLVPDDSGIVIESIGDGSGRSLVRVEVGQPLVITGRGFGTARGKLWLGTYYATVTEWTDTRIATTGAQSPTYPNRQMIGLWHASKGWGGNAWLGPYVMPKPVTTP